MILLLLGSCLHRPAPLPPGVAWRRVTVHREQLTEDGRYCAWDAEHLATADGIAWDVTPPDALGGVPNDEWCGAGGEASRTFDVVGERGPFLSTRLREERCCPERRFELCVTWDLRTRAPTTLEAIDPRRAAGWWAALQAQIAADPTLDDWRFSPDEFLLDGPEVRFCGHRDGRVHEVAVR